MTDYDFNTYYQRMRGYPARETARQVDRKTRAQELREQMDPPLPQPFRALRSVGTAVAGGVMDAAENVTNKAIKGAKGQVEAMTGAQLPDVSVDMPNVPVEDSLVHQIPRGLVQFAAAYAPVSRAVQGPALTRDIAAGAAADVLAFKNREEGNMSDFAIALGFDNSLTSWLSGQQSSTDFEADLKSALEGAGLGLAFNGLSRAYRVVRDNPKYAREIMERLAAFSPFALRSRAAEAAPIMAEEVAEQVVESDDKHPRGPDGRFVKKDNG